MEYKLREYQKKASDAAYNFFIDKKANYNAIEVLPTGCHARGSAIIMADGSISLVENIRIGDYLLGDDGSPRKVLELHRGVDKMYMITPIKGNPFSVNGGHILSLYKTNEGKNYLSCKPRIDEITVTDYVNTSNNYKHLHKLHRASFINFSASEKLSLSPYFLGIYLGDGSSSNGSINITTMRQEVKEFIYSFAESISMRVTDQFKGGNNKAHTYNIVYKKSERNILQKELDSLGLFRITCAFKFIPQKYKTASKEDRLQLLAGLLDTDSYLAINSNSFEYCSKSKRLVDDIVFVCHSLGFFAQIGIPKIVNGETYYRIQITGDLNIIPTKVGIRKGRKRRQKKSPLVTGFSVKYLGQGDYYGFTLDGNHLYCDYQFFIHHNSGKSLVLSDIASRLNSPVLVFQPSKEILAQNFEKYMSYDPFGCGIYSASMNQKDISKVTFATIGSAIGHKELFRQFKYIIIDEAHGVNPQKGMYKDFFESLGKTKILGLTATPYRLTSYSMGSILKFITRTRPAIFKKVIFNVQISTLLDMGYLANLNYYPMNPSGWNEQNLKINSTGADYTDKSVVREYERIDFYSYLVQIVRRLMNPKQGGKRKGILVFTRFIKESERLVQEIPNSAIVTGDTPKKEREHILSDFKSGKIKVVANAQVLTTGFDYPELDTIVLARPTMSLALYYQMVGRGIRPFENKTGWVVDLCSNIKRFGKVSDLKLLDSGNGKWAVYSNERQLTNVFF